MEFQILDLSQSNIFIYRGEKLKDLFKRETGIQDFLKFPFKFSIMEVRQIFYG